jgi:hypothetical protein
MVIEEIPPLRWLRYFFKDHKPEGAWRQALFSRKLAL